MRVLITGGRNFSDKDVLFDFLDKLHAYYRFTLLLHGGANGADKMSGEWASSRGITVEIYHADWKKHGLAAGPIRNQKMLDEKPELVVAFPGSRGTADMVRRAKKSGVNVIQLTT